MHNPHNNHPKKYQLSTAIKLMNWVKMEQIKCSSLSHSLLFSLLFFHFGLLQANIELLYIHSMYRNSVKIDNCSLSLVFHVMTVCISRPLQFIESNWIQPKIKCQFPTICSNRYYIFSSCVMSKKQSKKQTRRANIAV